MVEAALEKEGCVSVVVPHGVLFRGAAEGRIRQKMIEENLLDTVVGLPGNLFPTTSIPVAKLDVRLEDESVWLTQQMMAELYQTSKQNVSHHIQKIYEEGELQPEATVKKYLTVQQEGTRQVRRNLDYYNLDMIRFMEFGVGYFIAFRLQSGFDAAEPFKGHMLQIMRSHLSSPPVPI